MTQRWHDLLFAHWRCAMADLRPLVPALLAIDTFDGTPWVGVIPFSMTGVRLRWAPPIPTAYAFQELNVRTYVTLDGRPGVWFFSLDAASSLAVIAARAGARLPYFRASMAITKRAGTIDYRSDRWSLAGRSAMFEGRYRGLGAASCPVPQTLEHFLTERYSLYASDGKRIWRGDIVHPRWSLQAAEARIERNSMLAAAGIPTPGHQPLLHFAAFQDVRFWWPVRVR
jgi:uncharacterized protein